MRAKARRRRQGAVRTCPRSRRRACAAGSLASSWWLGLDRPLGDRRHIPCLCPARGLPRTPYSYNPEPGGPLRPGSGSWGPSYTPPVKGPKMVQNGRIRTGLPLEISAAQRGATSPPLLLIPLPRADHRARRGAGGARGESRARAQRPRARRARVARWRECFFISPSLLLLIPSFY